MHLLLIGGGNVTSRLNMTLQEHDHSIVAQIATLSPSHLNMFDCQGIVVVAPEATAGPDVLTKAAERGRHIFLVVGSSDGLAGWGDSVGASTFPYPLSDTDTQELLTAIRQADAGNTNVDDVFRRATLGGDMAARIQSGLATRKIAVSSPKGGTGKTTIAVNLAVAFALSGITTYLVDADGNAGAIYYHMRMNGVKSTLIGLLRRELREQGRGGVMDNVAASASLLDHFMTVDDLPTLKVLPGLITDQLSDKALQHEGRVTSVMERLFEVGTATGGVVVMDVGINPAHPIHRAAMRAAEGVAIVVKPELPDLAEARRWINRMVSAIERDTGNNNAAAEFIRTHVKLCYNQVYAGKFKTAHTLLQQTLRDEDEFQNIELTPNGIIPLVDPELAITAVNSDRRQDILIWRYKEERSEELQPFAEALIDFAAHFVPAVKEGAQRTGLLSNGSEPDKGLLFGLFG